MKTFAIDFETYYDKEVSVTTLGIYHYLRHPDCSIYLVAVYSEEAQFSYVGEPEEMDWGILHGQRLVAHNARFDRACFLRLQELGRIPAGIVPEWCCTADLASSLSSGRSLKDACHTLLGREISKDTRKDMKGLTWGAILMKGMAHQVAEYCLRDAWLCYHIWTQYAGQWSESERQLSALTRDMCDLGICIDSSLLDAGRTRLQEVMDSALEQIPWARNGNPVLSHKLLREECVKAHIPAPKSLAEDSEECAVWEEQYGERFPWVAAMRDYRKANTLFKKLQTIKLRLREDDSFSYGLKYFGAHTGRWSGDGGVNIQNLPRGEMFGVDLRRMIIPRPGHVFIISDLGQIEQRILSWLAGDNAMMEQLETGISVYEAHARATMGWRGGELKHENPDLYRLAKARVLGLGYGAGASVFPALAKAMAGLVVTPENAQKIVREFRASNPLITSLWTRLERGFASVKTGDVFTLKLPSGRSLYYRHVARDAKGMSAEVQGKRYSFFGGKLAENLTSATARDVLGDILLRLDVAGYRVVMHVHDEVVIEVPEARAAAAAVHVHKIMTTPPYWLEGLPLTAETLTSPYYTK